MAVLLLLLLPVLLLCTAAAGTAPAASAAAAAGTFPPDALWAAPGGGSDAAGASFAGVAASDAGFSYLTPGVLREMYGPDALSRARAWAAQGRVLWCGNASRPDDEPLAGEFPTGLPQVATHATSWPGACPGLHDLRAQQLIDAGLVWRSAFNDNDAACAFRAATRLAPRCALAHVLLAYTVSPNVNYPFVVDDSMHRLILESLKSARGILATASEEQHPAAAPLLQALLARMCVSEEEPGALDAALAMPEKEAHQAFHKGRVVCETAFQDLAAGLAHAYPEDPNFATIAVGALMGQPTWMWWQGWPNPYISG
ncbi:hypothetical protein FOA52_016212 [Chlamydomonas sp. UWO 241]|nr:hypothetical protein FOA52_016212 [Chlamydomonas sp. UWO 241]